MTFTQTRPRLLLVMMSVVPVVMMVMPAMAPVSHNDDDS
jgi:hypothetical protein